MSGCKNCPKAAASARTRWVAPARDVPLSGILNVDKPPGMTSHDVVDAVRRMAGQRKIGHAGTLDPMATGVLLLCLGPATRVSEYLMAGQKRYRATVVLGTMTDTYDADGKILSSGGRVDYSRGEIEAALAPFVGQIQQVPPIYSALKRDGQPLHKLARQGKEIQLEPRAVEIEEINLLDWTSPSLIVELTCSPGTYVRSLAHDLGQRLGGGAHLAALVRLASGRFGLDKAVSLERLETAFQHGQEGEYLLPVDEALLDWPATIVTAQDAQRLGQGQAISGYAAPGGDGEVQLSRAYSSEGVFLGILAFHAETGCWRPKKVFVTS